MSLIVFPEDYCEVKYINVDYGEEVKKKASG